LDPSTGKFISKKYFHGSYPVIRLGKEEYDYINGAWSTVGKGFVMADYNKSKISHRK